MLKENKAYKFYEQVKQEALKVSWPKKKELLTSIFIVLIAVLVSSMIFLVLDYSIHKIVQFLLTIGKQF
ncbi:MAG: preprotein translocase subunit SecE [Rickettsiaceae bacterium]|nr:MAG: preprotein translocase subunit SecE [Rickettsiaceae bacterium]